MDDELLTVELYYSKKSITSSAYKTEFDCWISMIEQLLQMECSNYTVSVDYGPYDRGTKIVIKFDNLEDATWFRLLQK